MKTTSIPFVSGKDHFPKDGKNLERKRKSHPKAKNSDLIPKLDLNILGEEKVNENKPVPNTSRAVKKTTKQKRPLTSRATPSSKICTTSRVTTKIHINPIVPNGPITSEAAKATYGAYLNSFESKEIDDFEDIYFLGHQEIKILPNHDVSSNCGYDDKTHHYKVKIGDQIAYRFEIRSILGKGAFGQVLRCFDYKTKSYVALKMIVNTPVMNEQGQVELALLQHLNEADGHETAKIMNGIDFFIFRNHICMTSDILGPNLYEVSRQMRFRPFTISQVKSISRDILKGLEFIHKNQVVHCDLKPENILLCPGSTKKAKIIDFGSSCMVGEQKFEYIQSRYYRAPEVMLGIRYGPPMDIWSFACIVIEMLLGRPLFDGSNEAEQMSMYMEVFGFPSHELIDNSPRRKYYFDEKYAPISDPKIKKKRRPGSVSLSASTRFTDSLLLDLLSKCFKWDQKDRITATEALKHPFFDQAKKKEIKQRPSITDVLESATVKTVRWR